MSMIDDLKAAESLSDLAEFLGYKPKALAFILYKIPPTAKYSEFEIKKKSGGSRKIQAPIEQLKSVQRILAARLYDCRDEIEKTQEQKVLSHGFRRRHSVRTNATRHKRKRYVLNLDLQDFFPSLNFGRVRGFFISNKHFELHEAVATRIAQIACHENSLPQGSPCSPVIADLIAHILDVRLVQIAKKHGLTYSRYADDITFSTNQRNFPKQVALETSLIGVWNLSAGLVDAISKCGFSVNEEKSRMQVRGSRQLVTGLTVNDKVNIRPEYYRTVRSMCNRLFHTNSYFRLDPDGNEEELVSLNPLEGMLSHIHNIKDNVDHREETEKRKEPTAFRKLYRRFLVYRKFASADKPLIVCEGKTDNVYLKLAIMKRFESHPTLGGTDSGEYKSYVSFFGYESKSNSVLELFGGSSDLRFFFVKSRYSKYLEEFENAPLSQPVIILIDNDEGAKPIFSTISKNFGLNINLTSNSSFYHVVENLYLVKTMETGPNNKTCIEDCFPKAVRDSQLNGKKFNPGKGLDVEKEFGKQVFAERVVRANANKIDFSGFDPVLNRISAAIIHFKSLSAGSS